MSALRLRPKEQKAPRSAAVLVPLMTGGELSVLFEVRSAAVYQPGEVCFPGGGMELGESPRDCALRETQEELGIAPEKVRIFAELEPYIHISSRTVYPVLGELSPDSAAHITQSEAEVAETFTAPLQWFRDHPPEVVGYDMVPDPDTIPEMLYPTVSRYRNRRKTLVWNYQGHLIWGLTARILQEVLQRVTEE